MHSLVGMDCKNTSHYIYFLYSWMLVLVIREKHPMPFRVICLTIYPSDLKK